MFDLWREDIEAVMSRDPAARSVLEVLLCYPGFRAVRRHRRAHWLWVHNFKLLARMVSQRTRKLTGIEIHPGAVIGKGLLIDHGMGVIIGETAEVGDNVTIYQDVTLGGTGKDSGKRHPTVGSHVVIGAGAKVLGPFTVGDNAKIGAGSIVLREVPANSTVVGNPGRVVRGPEKSKAVVDLDQVHLPDPVKEYIQLLNKRIEQLESCMKRNAMEDVCRTCEDTDTEKCIKAERESDIYADI